MTIQEAMAQLRVVVPALERSLFIKCEVRDYDHLALNDPARRAIVFTIWDEREHYEGPTLEIAVQKCLLANTPDQAQIEEAEAFAVEAASSGIAAL